MKVLITGASGTIGTAVCDALLARGDQVVGLSRDPDGSKRTNPRISWHAWNPTLERPPEEAFDGVDGVVNLVGEPINQRWTEDAKKRILESRETPGLGDKIYKDADFVANFRSLSVEPEILAVKKGTKSAANEVDAITGATISSKAVVRIINEGNAKWLPRLETLPTQSIPQAKKAEDDE